MLALRQQHPHYGKMNLRPLLNAQGIDLSASMIGRVLASLRRCQYVRDPDGVRVRHRRAQRPYATRVPKDQRQPTQQGKIVQPDSLHLRPEPGIERRQFTAIDVVSRCAVLGVRSRAHQRHCDRLSGGIDRADAISDPGHSGGSGL